MDKKETKGTEETKSAGETQLTDAQVRARLDTVLAGMKQQTVTDAATLQDMLGEGEEIRRRGITFIAVPPSIRELPAIGRLLQLTSEGANGGGQAVIDTEIAIARRLFWVRDGDSMRQATEDEIGSSFTRGALTKITLDTLARNGLDPKKTEAASQD